MELHMILPSMRMNPESSTEPMTKDVPQTKKTYVGAVTLVEPRWLVIYEGGTDTSPAVTSTRIAHT